MTAGYCITCRTVRAPRRYAAFVAYTLHRRAILKPVPDFGWVVIAPGLETVYFRRREEP